jgi:lipoprotein-releasing system ATP-binding protein
LGHRFSHKPGQLSGGEQQRVAIARALVMSPKLLMADEPTGNLDSGTTEAIYELLQQLHDRHGLTMIIVTHSERLARRMDRTLHMVDGLLEA